MSLVIYNYYIIINQVKMFTGVIKLTNIDDYISPSQSCIQPKIMKKDKKQQKATVTLNDCLACSGCITSAQSILIQQMSINKFIELSNSIQQIFVMVSPQSILSLAKFYKIQLNQFMHRLEIFMKKNFKNVIKVFQMALAIQIEHQLIFLQFMERFNHKNLPVLCSQCPGWVCYAQKKTDKDTVTHTMSSIKSPQQIMGQLIKQKYGKQVKVVSIMPCFDKKLQAIRFQYQQKLKQVDLTIATNQLGELIKKMNGQEYFTNKLQMIQDLINFSLNESQNSSQKQQGLQFFQDQASNGYIQFILNRLQIKDYSCEQIKNSDFKQYNFNWNGTPFKMAKCYGFRNIQKIVQMIKKNKCPYIYIQIMACPGGCFGGGGQIRYEGIKNKQIIAQFQETLKKYPIVKDWQNNLDLQKFQLDRNKIYVEYKPIQKSFSQSAMNW